MSKPNYTIEILKQEVEKALCWSDVCRGVNVSVCTFNYKRMQNLCKENNIPTDHFNVKKAYQRGKRIWTTETLFTTDSTPYRTIVKDFMKRNNMIKDTCEECGQNSNWNNKQLNMELDHINGNSKDNRLENLKFLCPNCHSQTSTYKRKKI
jgi:5-methylcytosine-specific restriction endonuclease McrA